ncbi:MAG: glycosyltransferase [Candidatus Helarchaeota archaeon]
MRICYFGTYDSKVPRNSMFIKALKINGVEVKEVNFHNSIPNHIKAFFNNLKMDYDAVIIGYTTEVLTPEYFLAKLSSIRPIFSNPLISLYDTEVFDRKNRAINSTMAKFLYYRDLLNLKCADCIILDTYEHIKYFKELFPLNDKAFERVFVGSDESKSFPQKVAKNTEKFLIFFYGSYIPLHGIEYIIRAAKILEKEKDILFRLAGWGQKYNYIQTLTKSLKIKNIEFLPPLPYAQYNLQMNMADICLGIFGTSRKAKSIIPHKVFDALATAKPIITGDSPAIRELLKNEVNCLLCKMGSPKSLAEAMTFLKEDPSLRKKIAKNGYSLFRKRLSLKPIGRSILSILNRFC